MKRIAIAPELPTIDESGVKGFDVFSWFAFFLPVKTPKEIATKLHTDTVAALKHEPCAPACSNSAPTRSAPRRTNSQSTSSPKWTSGAR